MAASSNKTSAGKREEGPGDDRPALSALITPILKLREIDTNIYQGTDLWRPLKARGVFGGQVVGQALNAATKTVTDGKAVNSLHSYFLLAGDPTVPITYQVRRMRDGKSFSSRSVVASQRGRPIYFCMASFHRPEHSAYAHQEPMPEGVPDPDSLPDHASRMRMLLDDPRLPEVLRARVEREVTKERPIDIRFVNPANPLDGPVSRPPHHMAWMRARGKLHDEVDQHISHQVIAAFASDFMLLSTSVLPHGGNTANPNLKMIVSLDHSMWFHAPFRADEWMLYVMDSTRSESARGLSFGRLYTRDGRLVVSTAQEGLVRMTGTPPSQGVSGRSKL